MQCTGSKCRLCWAYCVVGTESVLHLADCFVDNWGPAASLTRFLLLYAWNSHTARTFSINSHVIKKVFKTFNELWICWKCCSSNIVKVVRTEFAKHFFWYSAPFVWNSLPTQIVNTTFKSRLKSHFFTLTFDSHTLLIDHHHSTSTSEVTTLWHYTNVIIISIIIN